VEFLQRAGVCLTASIPPQSMVWCGCMGSRMNRLIIAALVSVLFATGGAFAHPHVWVTMKTTVVYAPDGAVVGLRHAWTFDDMFSTFATQGLESKQKGVFTRDELQPLAKVNVDSLKEYDYFTYAKANGKKAAFTDPVDYYLEYRDAVLTLHFLLPFKTPLKAQTLDFEVYDPTYFVDFALADKEPAVLAGAPAACRLSIGKPQEMTKELALKLSQIPPDQQIPENSYGAQFANKISVKCP
jgi:ABC-type uncharacterized transport system substrate-binding protein